MVELKTLDAMHGGHAEVAGEEAALGPLHAVAEDDLAEGEEDDPAGWFFLGEDVFAEDVFPGGKR
jgi:hypothetical protein